MVDGAGLADEIAAFVLSGSCAGCHRPGTLLCGHCRGQLLASVELSRTPEGMPVIAALRFESVAARCIRRIKENGETLLARPLGAALAPVCDRVAAEHPDAAFVPVPTSQAAFRRRGYRVPELLLRRAGRRPTRLLRLIRRTADQRGLDVDQRQRNVAASMHARAVRGVSEVVLFDDVTTTGATIDEASRALAAVGIRVRAAVALAATPRRSEF